jgi:hypothetical protein
MTDEKFNEQVARERVNLSLAELREALSNYRKVTGNEPSFILQKNAPQISLDSLHSCKVYPDRYSLIKAIAPYGIAAEVGVQHGFFSQYILNELSPLGLHLFDVDFSILFQNVADHPSVTLHEGDSSVNLSNLPNQYFDWIYIDANHSYEGVKRDIAQCTNKLKRGGILIFNDYTVWSPLEAEPYGVVCAVNELINSGQWDMLALAVTPNGYFDVALKFK